MHGPSAETKKVAASERWLWSKFDCILFSHLLLAFWNLRHQVIFCFPLQFEMAGFSLFYTGRMLIFPTKLPYTCACITNLMHKLHCYLET